MKVTVDVVAEPTRLTRREARRREQATVDRLRLAAQVLETSVDAYTRRYRPPTPGEQVATLRRIADRELALDALLTFPLLDAGPRRS